MLDSTQNQSLSESEMSLIEQNAILREVLW